MFTTPEPAVMIGGPQDAHPSEILRASGELGDTDAASHNAIRPAGPSGPTAPSLI